MLKIVISTIKNEQHSVNVTTMKAYIRLAGEIKASVYWEVNI